jgi:hypothetical protein
MALESELEKDLGTFVRSLGCLYYKFKSPSNRGVPDRIVICPEGRVLWLELKAPGKRPTKLQMKHLTTLAAYKQHAYWVDNLNQGKQLIVKLVNGTL